jgi:TM2 domain-containing membrane protein YozV
MNNALVRRRWSLPVGYILMIPCFFGLSGLHRFYLGRWKSGLLWLFTGGLCGLGNLIDLLLMPHMVSSSNKGGTGW